jgi:hypothetical protein
MSVKAIMTHGFDSMLYSTARKMTPKVVNISGTVPSTAQSLQYRHCFY